jgi:hypothetical protein
MDPTIETTANPGRPVQTTRGVQLLYASLAIGLIRAIFGLTRTVSGTTLILAALIVIAVFSLGFFLIWRISAGRNLARILLLVLVLVGLPFAIRASVVELKQSIASGSLSMIIAVLQLVGTYLLFTKNSNLWFRQRK